MRHRSFTCRRAGRLAGAARDGNALRRPTDRIESMGVLAAVAMVLATIPVAVLLGLSVYQHDLAMSAQQTASERQVTATLLRNSAAGTPAEGVHATVRTEARWTLPSGTQHIGTVRAPVGMAAGTTIPILIDRGGTPVNPALGVGPAVEQGAVTTATAVAAVATLLWAAVGILRWRLNRSRYAAWANEWAHISPGWTQPVN